MAVMPAIAASRNLGTDTPPLVYRNVVASGLQSSLPVIAEHMFGLMMRNVASDGFVFADPFSPGRFSVPGCIIASPSYPADLATVDQDYVFNWTRDAALTALEIAAATKPARPGEGIQPLIDYVTFAKTCQNSGAPTIGHACFTIEGQPRPWPEQSDGPALQTLAILEAFPQLDAAGQAVGTTVATTNLNYLLGAYQMRTTNLWEEHSGQSFFARAVQLRCFQAISANTAGIAAPPGTAQAISWLQAALAEHWDGQRYVSILNPTPDGYDPNIDIILACIYGAVTATDPKLLATAAQLRQQWSDQASTFYYPINGDDAGRGIGPALGRYPGDTYDGDVRNPVLGGHPWALCTCGFAQLYYRVANAVTAAKTVPLDPVSQPFFDQVGIGAATAWADAATSLQNAGDRMLNAVIFHSDHLELSEQFDGTTGYEKSVRNLTWSYASFLSAVREKTGRSIAG